MPESVVGDVLIIENVNESNVDFDGDKVEIGEGSVDDDIFSSPSLVVGTDVTVVVGAPGVVERGSVAVEGVSAVVEGGSVNFSVVNLGVSVGIGTSS